MIEHTQEWWNGYKTAMETMKMLIESEIKANEYAIERQDATGKTIAGFVKTQHERTITSIDGFIKDIPEVEQ